MYQEPRNLSGLMLGKKPCKVLVANRQSVMIRGFPKDLQQGVDVASGKVLRITYWNQLKNHLSQDIEHGPEWGIHKDMMGRPLQYSFLPLPAGSFRPLPIAQGYVLPFHSSLVTIGGPGLGKKCSYCCYVLTPMWIVGRCHRNGLEQAGLFDGLVV